MASFEKFIRPFVNRDVTPPKIVTVTADVTPTNVTLVYGAKGNGKIYTVSFSGSISTYADKRLKEASLRT